MIMLRMPIAQPPNITRKSEAKGKNQCWKTLPMNAQERFGLHRIAVRTGDRENAQNDAKKPGQQDPQPHVGRGSEDVTDGRNGVIQPLGARRKSAKLIACDTNSAGWLEGAERYRRVQHAEMHLRDRRAGTGRR